MDQNSIVSLFKSPDATDHELAIMALHGGEVFRTLNKEQIAHILPYIFQFCYSYSRLVQKTYTKIDGTLYTARIKENTLRFLCPLKMVKSETYWGESNQRPYFYQFDNWQKDNRYKKTTAHTVLDRVLTKIVNELTAEHT